MRHDSIQTTMHEYGQAMPDTRAAQQRSKPSAEFPKIPLFTAEFSRMNHKGEFDFRTLRKLSGLPTER